MRKTLMDLAAYLKTIVLPETDETYTVDSLFETVFSEEKIWEGVFAYRSFLLALFDCLIEKGVAYDYHKKVTHEYENRTTLSVYYPFLHHVKTLLMNIGLLGKISEDNQQIICSNHIFHPKFSTAKTIEALQFLVTCGVQIKGIELDKKRQDLSALKSITISYPANPAMLVGLKVFAVAEKELGTLDNQDIFLRCDYRALGHHKTDPIFILRDTIRTLPIDEQHFLLGLHKRYIDKGLKCEVEIKGFWIYIKYTYKRKVIWGINASLNNGFHINVKAQNMDKYASVIERFAPFLKDTIKKGYGCGRKRENIGHCDGGCRGMIIPVDRAILKMSKDIEAWLDKELAFIS